MPSNKLNASSEGLDLTIMDMGPLAGMLDEPGKSLDRSSKVLKRSVRETGLTQGAELLD